MSSISFSQTIGGIAFSKSGIEICMGNDHNRIFTSTDLKFPTSTNPIGYLNMGIGHSFNSNVISFKNGLYSPSKYEPLKFQYGIEYLRNFEDFYVGISYLSSSKLSLKFLIKIH